jgi:hypothetical protein
MLTRCNNKNAVQYPHYGDKGIRVEWPSFAEFKNDMYKSYLLHIEKYGETQTSIDRIKNAGNYSKANCKWSTLREQGKNKTNNILIAFNSKTQCLSEWAKEFNLPYFTLLKRYRKNWPIEKLFRASEITV